jgi:hypothetical protein
METVTCYDMHLRANLVQYCNRKVTIEKLKLTARLKIKPGPIHKLKTIKRDMNSDCSDHRHNTKIQNTCI